MSIVTATEAQHRGAADLPFVEIGGGDKKEGVPGDGGRGRAEFRRQLTSWFLPAFAGLVGGRPSDGTVVRPDDA